MKLNKMLVILTVCMLVMMGTASSWAATISGTLTNSSGKDGWINISLNGQNGSTGLGTAVNLISGTSTTYTVYGVMDGTYTVGAYVDTTATGMRHVNDPFTSVSSVTVSGSNVTQNLTIGIPSITSMAQALVVNIAPTDGGAFVDIQYEKDQFGRAIPDSINLVCDTDAANYPSVITTNDNSFALVSGLTNGSTLNCTATPVVNGSAVPALLGSGSATIGDCTLTSCTGTTRLTGKVAFDAGVSLTGKTLYVAAVPPVGGQPYVAVAKVLANPATIDIYGVPAGTYKIYSILDNNSHTLGVGDLQIQDYTAPVIVVSGADPIMTLPTVTLKDVNSYFNFNVSHNRNSQAGGTDLDYNFGIQVENGLSRPVNVLVKALDQTTVNFSLGHTDYGSGFWANSPSMSRPTVGVTYGYADIAYADGTTDSNIPLIPRYIRDDFPFNPTMQNGIGVSFPSGNVRFPDNGNPKISWRTPVPLPGYFYSYRASLNGFNTQNDNPNDFLLPNVLASSFDLLGNGSSALSNDVQYSWGMNLRDQFGNSTNLSTQFTPKSTGPVISSFSPTSGLLSGSIAVTGSGFTGASAVSINGYFFNSSFFTVVDDAHLTINLSSGSTGSGFSSGPILITAGGITGSSSSSYTGLASVSGTITDSAAANITGATIKLVGSNPAMLATSAAGTYTLNGIPAGMPYLLQISAGGSYLPAYTKFMNQNNTGTGFNWTLYTAAEVGPSGWGVTPGKGVIRARVTGPTSGDNLSSATVTATSWLHPETPYIVKYGDSTTLSPPVEGALSTSSSGVFYVMNVDEGDIVSVSAQKDGYGFQPLAYQVHADAVSEGRVIGAVIPTSITATTTTLQNPDLSYNGSISVSFNLSPLSTSLTPSIPNYSGSILYTTDGRDPQFYGTSITVGPTIPPISINSTTTLRYVFKSNNNVFGPSGTTTFVIRSQPTINTIYPTMGVVDMYVTIYGTNFDTTTPANNKVYFPNSSTQAQIVSATSTQLTVVVPGDASGTGQILLDLFGMTANSGSTNFTVTTKISLSGIVKEAGIAGNLSGATVQMYASQIAAATSDSNGFTLSNLPANTAFITKTSLLTYADSYMQLWGSQDITNQALILIKSPLTAAPYSNPSGTGLVRGKISNSANGASLAGATISISPANGGVIVYGGTTAGSPPDEMQTSTPASGIFYIRNIAPGTNVQINTTRAGFTFSSYNATAVSGDSLIQVDVQGYLSTPPNIYATNDNTGVAGTSITVIGSFPDQLTANYLVTFDGTTPAVISSPVNATDLNFTIPVGTFTYFTVSYYGQQFYIGNLLTVNIVGEGTINETFGSGFTCGVANCMRYFDQSANLNLSPSPSAGSIFGDWNPICSGTGANDCGFGMSTPVTRTVTFAPDTALPTNISGTNVYRSSLQSIFEYFADNGPYPAGTSILLTSDPLSGNFTTTRDATVTIKGGYASGFASRPDTTFTTVTTPIPPFAIKSGKIVFDRIRIK